MIKRTLSIIMLGACMYSALWLYNIQLGAIPFILLSFFLFYRALAVIRTKSKDEKLPEEVIQEETDEKKAEIFT
ncbi:hypothetical protein QYG89_08090 [Bacillus sp. B190/17]|uniref:Uncharacterized protein n=1 Tax=Bacillus lumedeiriae TaxID=3058829 RepID=A0ABW8I911_9BACI